MKIILAKLNDVIELLTPIIAAIDCALDALIPLSGGKSKKER